MRIGVIAPRTSWLAGRVLAHLESVLPGMTRHMDLSLTEARIALDGDGVMHDGLDLAGLERVWVHGFSYDNPVIPQGGEHTDWSVWQYDHLCRQQEFSTLFSLLRELERRGVSVWNGVGVHVDHFMKFALLERIRAAGYPVPALMALNDPKEAAAFGEGKERLVWRPATGRAAWQLFGARQARDRVDPRKPPVLLAEVMPGALTRGVIIGGRLMGCIQCQAPAFLPPDESLERVWTLPVEPYRRVVEALARTIGLQWGMVVFTVGDAGHWFYDIDPDPHLEWLPMGLRETLSRMLAHALIGTEEHGSPLANDAPEAMERAAPFARRLLNALFEMENSKYVA
ncbi:MAG: hypothetical protein HQM03_11145 [Magnetococcales bacterium]|nr:hypothetical protein [Magnetococcales bacterium]